MAALLYLVTEELLIEAHENGAGHVWYVGPTHCCGGMSLSLSVVLSAALWSRGCRYVDLMFFAGFIISVLLEQAVDSRSP